MGDSDSREAYDTGQETEADTDRPNPAESVAASEATKNEHGLLTEALDDALAQVAVFEKRWATADFDLRHAQDTNAALELNLKQAKERITELEAALRAEKETSGLAWRDRDRAQDELSRATEETARLMVRARVAEDRLLERDRTIANQRAVLGALITERDAAKRKAAELKKALDDTERVRKHLERLAGNDNAQAEKTRAELWDEIESALGRTIRNPGEQAAQAETKQPSVATPSLVFEEPNWKTLAIQCGRRIKELSGMLDAEKQERAKAEQKAMELNFARGEAEKQAVIARAHADEPRGDRDVWKMTAAQDSGIAADLRREIETLKDVQKRIDLGHAHYAQHVLRQLRDANAEAERLRAALKLAERRVEENDSYIARVTSDLNQAGTALQQREIDYAEQKKRLADAKREADERFQHYRGLVAGTLSAMIAIAERFVEDGPEELGG